MGDSEMMPAGATGESPPAILRRLFPGVHALLHFKASDLRFDLLAAVTLAAYLLPSNIGDASLAGLPAESGLYSCLFAGLVFWLFCSSRHTAVTVTSAISLLIGSSLVNIAGTTGDTTQDPHYWAMAATTAILVGLLSSLAWLVRAGSLVNFISETVLLGFKAGVALHLASTQLPKLFGFSGAHGGDFWERVQHFFVHLRETNGMALVFGGIALAIILAGKKWLKNKPVALFVMIGGIMAATLMNVEGQGVKLLGNIPQGMPPLVIPAVGWSDVRELFPLALACFMLSAVENAAIGRMFAQKHGYRLNANQEFLALAAANIASGLGRGYAVGGGMSQSLVNESAGARTSLSGLFAALLILVITVFFSGLLHNLPQPVLAAIVLAAVTGLFKVKELARLWRFSRGEFAVAMTALAGVLCFGLLQGVMIGALLSILMLVRRASRPNTAELGRVPGTEYFADLERHAENQRARGVFVFRASSALVYFNVQHVRDRFDELLARREDPIEVAVFFMGAVPMVDLAGAEMLMELHHALRSRGIAFHLAEAHGPVRDALRRAGYEDQCGKVRANQSVPEVLAQIPQAATGSAAAPAPITT